MFMKWWTENLSRKKFRISLLLSICFLLAATSGCSLLPEEEGEEVLPEITPPRLSQKPEYTVTTETIETKVRGVGKILSLQEETLFFTEDNRRVKEIYVKTGDQVAAGQLIAELDVTELQNELRQKKLEMRSDELKMIQTLRKADELSPEELEQEKINFELKRTELLELQEKIDRAKLTAPFAGTVVSLSIAKGDEVKAYDPVAVIADLSQLTVAAEISAEDLKRVAVGMEAEVDINALGVHKGIVKRLPVEGGEESGNDPYYPGNNRNREKTIDDYLLVELEQFPEGATRGTPLSVSIVTQRKENAIVIPPSALRTHMGRTYVQVVEEDGTKREVDVEVGQRTSTLVEIVKGLEPGQKVVGN